MKKVSEICNLYIATLRALYIVEKNCHWLSSGAEGAFYAQHLLFDRIAERSIKDSDLAAEKMIGIFQKEGFNMALQTQYFSKLLNKYQDEKNLYELCFKMESDFLDFSQQCYDFFEKEDVLTMGLDDFLMSTCSGHEESYYLLQQALTDNE
jgi:DNA-binding ferritin-like protein